MPQQLAEGRMRLMSSSFSSKGPMPSSPSWVLRHAAGTGECQLPREYLFPALKELLRALHDANPRAMQAASCMAEKEKE